jgi:hypothetical protein
MGAGRGAGCRLDRAVDRLVSERGGIDAKSGLVLRAAQLLRRYGMPTRCRHVFLWGPAVFKERLEQVPEIDFGNIPSRPFSRLREDRSQNQFSLNWRRSCISLSWTGFLSLNTPPRNS